MDIVAKFQNWVLRKPLADLAKVQARYEAAYWNLNRTYLPGFVQSARDDINAMSRQEILRRVRYFEKNSPVMLKILRILDINVVGSGITPSPATEAMEWNKAALAWWNTWAQVADISGHSNIYGLQSIAYRGVNVDGDSFIRLTTRAGRPAVEVIEAHRVSSLGYDLQQMARQGFRVFDGVIVDQTGQPVAYIVANEFDASKSEVVPASEIIPIFTKQRSGQYRGVTKFHAAIIDLHDLDDLQKYEMRAAKDAASMAKVVTTAAGSVTPDGNAIGASLTKTPAATTPGQRDAYYKQALGGETLVTFPGDVYNQYKGERPSAATTGFWDKLDQKIVQGAGVSYAALVDYMGNWGGATLRAAVTGDNRLYELATIEQSNAWQRVWEYAMGWAMARGEVPANPDFRNVRWHPPRRTTVDVGHESDSMLNELKAGVQNYQGIFGEQGEDWRERIEQRAIEEKFISEIADKYGIDRQYIASFAQERLAGQAPDAVAGTPASPGQSGAPPAPANTPKGGKK